MNGKGVAPVVGIVLGQERDRRRVPQVVGAADEGDEHGKHDHAPAQPEGEQRAAANHQGRHLEHHPPAGDVDDQAAGEVGGDGADVKHGDQGAGLGIGQTEVGGNERQQQIEGGGDPVGPGVAEPDQESRSLARPSQAGEAFDGGNHRPPPHVKTGANLSMRPGIDKAQPPCGASDFRTGGSSSPRPASCLRRPVRPAPGGSWHRRLEDSAPCMRAG